MPERTGYALGCRIYATQEGLRGSPTAEMVRASLAERNLVRVCRKIRRIEGTGKADQHDGGEQGHRKAGLRDRLDRELRAGRRDRGPRRARQRATPGRPAR